MIKPFSCTPNVCAVHEIWFCRTMKGENSKTSKTNDGQNAASRLFKKTLLLTPLCKLRSKENEAVKFVSIKPGHQKSKFRRPRTSIIQEGQ